MEYDAIQLVNDFITEGKLKEIVTQNKKEEINLSKLNEEINLLYVAVTRTKNSIHIPEPLMPFDFQRSPQIHIEKVESEEKREEKQNVKIEYKPIQKLNLKKEIKEKAYSVDKIRMNHKDAYKPWTEELDDELTEMYCKEESVIYMAVYFGRTQGSIRARIKKLELEEKYGKW